MPTNVVMFNGHSTNDLGVSGLVLVFMYAGAYVNASLLLAHMQCYSSIITYSSV
jgi:hypothetical protein